ncbi:MAG: GYD domain-containing protein [Nitrospirota bacterium]|nr:MAG: GYD domain-containing protein [Nitrospirota bacterium]
MATFISLFVWTEQGVHNVKDTADRAAKFKQSIQAAGGSVKNIYWTMGRYDGIIIFEAPDDATAAAVMMGGCAQGNVRSETLCAFDENEMMGVLKKIPS